MIVRYVIVRREPHGEAVDTYIMACATTAPDAEEFILGCAETYSYNAFCEAIYNYEATLEEAIEVGKKAEIYYIDNTFIYPVPEV